MRRAGGRPGVSRSIGHQEQKILILSHQDPIVLCEKNKALINMKAMAYE